MIRVCLFLIAFIASTGLCPRNSLADHHEGQEVFESFCGFMVGGTWVRNDNGEKHTYKWVYQDKLVQLTGKGETPIVAMICVEPETNKCTWWAFREDGGVIKSVLTNDENGGWLLSGKGNAPDGERTLIVRARREGDNTLHVTSESTITSNGNEETEKQDRTWTRQK